MHQPTMQEISRDFGITGKKRFRRQRFTGKLVLQIEVVREESVVKGMRTFSKTYTTYWRDAKGDEGLQIARDICFIRVPESWSDPQGKLPDPPKIPKAGGPDKIITNNHPAYVPTIDD